MIAPEYFNNHIAVEGEIIVKRVPNDTGSVLVWNSTTKKISTRTHADIIADLSLMTTNTYQGITGHKVFYNDSGSSTVGSNSITIWGNNGSKAGISFYSAGMAYGHLNYDGWYRFQNSDDSFAPIQAGGFKKENGDNNSVLLDGGGSKPISEFALSNHVHKYLSSDATGVVDLNNLMQDGILRYDTAVYSGSTNMFPAYDAANAVLSISSFGGYNTQLGFNTFGDIYTRSKGNAGNTITDWKKIITSAEFDGKVGARNLIQDAKNFGFYASDASRSNNSVLGEITITDSSGFWNAYSSRLLFDYTPGSELLYQVEISHNNSTPIDMTFYFYNDGDSQVFNQVIPPNVWTKVTRVSSPNHTTSVLMGIGGNNTDIGTKIYYRNKQVEEGIVASTYRPAYEDFVFPAQLDDYWKKLTTAGYTGINASTPFSVLNNGQAQKIYGGGLLISDAYQDEGSIPSNGIYSKSHIITGANFYGKGLYSPVVPGGQIINAYSGSDVYFGNPNIPQIWIESADSNIYHNRSGYGAGVMWDAHNFNPDSKVPTSHPSYGITLNELNNWRGYLGYKDDRLIYPDEISPTKLQYGFTSWNNDGGSIPTWGDFLHFGGYSDTSGGNQNLVVFKKNGFGLRQWQGTSQSPAHYQSFVDYWHTGNLSKDEFVNLGLGKASIDITGTDLNNLRQTGFFKGSNLTNSPTGLDEWFFITLEYHDSGWASQTATAYGTNSSTQAGRTFKRSYTGGTTWSSWYEVHTSLTFNPDNKITQQGAKYRLHWDGVSDNWYRNDVLLGYMLTSFNISNFGFITNSYLISQLNNYILTSQKGQPNGVATLDNSGLVPASQLPSYVDDVLEFANLNSFPSTGEMGKIYVATDTNQTYRWSGSTYIQIASGAVQSVNNQVGIVNLIKSDIGLGNVDNTADSVKNVAYAVTSGNSNDSANLGGIAAADYVTRNTDQIIDGKKVFNAYFDAYTPDGLFDPNARTLKINTPSSQKILFGYRDYGGGQYYPRIGFTSDSSLTKWSVGPLGNDFVIGINNDGVETFKIRPSGATSKIQNQTQIFDKVYQGSYPDGSHPTGILVLKMPQASPEEVMFSIDINVYGYESSYIGKINVSFYKYVSGLIIPNGAKSIFNVTENFPTNVARVGIGSDGLVSILIGQPDTFWNGYLSFEVERVQTHYGNYTPDWSQGWSHAMESDISQYGSNIITLPTDVVATKSWTSNNFASTTQLNDKVNKSGDNMTGALRAPILYSDQLITDNDNTMLRVGNNGDVGIVKKGGYAGFFAVGQQGFIVKYSSTVGAFTPSSTFIDLFEANAAGAFVNGNQLWDSNNLPDPLRNNGDNTLKTIDASNYNDVIDGKGKIWLGNFYALPESTTGFQSNIGTILNINGLVAHDKTQLIFNGGNGNIQYRTSWYANTPWSPVRTLWDSNNLPNPATQSQLLDYVSIANPQTIVGDKRFAEHTVKSDLGFQTTSYLTDSRNRIWSFANSDNHGLSYFQGGFNPLGEGVSFHFGDATDYMFFVKNNGQLYSKIHGNSSLWYEAYSNMLPNQNWSGSNAISTRRTVGELAWRNYGNGHTIFDASSSLSPSGVSINNANPQVNWDSTYPTLMGWNGYGTYGVRVDSARNSDNLGNISASSYVTQTSLNSQLNGVYATLNGVQTFTQTNTFSQNIIIPNATLGGHAVNANILNANDRCYITDTRGAVRPPSYYDRRYAQWDFQNSADTQTDGDAWQGILTVSKWDTFNPAHRQEQLIFTGTDLKRRTAIDDDTWGVSKTIWDSGNLLDYKLYGLGTISPVNASDINNITHTSIQDVNDGTSNSPIGYGSVWTHRKSATEYTQYVIDVLNGNSYTRGYSNAYGSTGWKKNWNDSDFNYNDISIWSEKFKTLKYTSDLDSVIDSGIYRQENPSSGYNYTTTLNLNSSDGRQQLSIKRDGEGMKFRGSNYGSGNIWTSWKDVIHSDNITAYLNTYGFATQSWVSSNYMSTSHIANSITYTNILQWNDIFYYGLRLNNIFSSNTGSGLMIADDYFGSESGLVDAHYENFVAGKQKDYYKYGSLIYDNWDGLNYNVESHLFGIGKEVTNKEDKVQVSGNISVDTINVFGDDMQLILNPLHNTNGDVRDSRNAHIYIVTRETVRLPKNPILGQRIEIFNDGDGEIEVMHDNVGTLFYLPGFGKITGIVGGKGFIFDEKPIPAKHYSI